MQESHDPGDDDSKIPSQQEQDTQESSEAPTASVTNKSSKYGSLLDIIKDSTGKESPLVESVQSDAKQLEIEFQRKIVQAMVKSHKRRMADKDRLLPPERAQLITSRIQDVEKEIERTMHRLNDSHKQQLDLLNRLEDMERLILERERSKVIGRLWTKTGLTDVCQEEIFNKSTTAQNERRVVEVNSGESVRAFSLPSSCSKEEWPPEGMAQNDAKGKSGFKTPPMNSQEEKA